MGLAEPLLSRAASILLGSSIPGPLRTLDAVQLASALEAQRRQRRSGGPALVFVTADQRLEVAARRSGLAVENPNRYE